MSVENTLKERGARYGSFEEHATIAQAIQDAFRVYPEKWNRLPPVVKQGFTTLADKFARAINGDPMYDDNYHDIGGYAKLMEDWVKKNTCTANITSGTISVTGSSMASSDTTCSVSVPSVTTGCVPSVTTSVTTGYVYNTNDR